MPKKKLTPTFEVRFVGPDVTPERISLRAVSDALAAVQDLASGRDSFETSRVPPERTIRLINVRKGSAVYGCVSQAPDEAMANFAHVAMLLSSDAGSESEDDGLVAAMSPIESLSVVARAVPCKIEVSSIDHRAPIFTIDDTAFEQLSSRLLLRGDTTVVGRVERVGGATHMRCLLRVPGRRQLLYCNVDNKDVVRRLGQHLYEDIAATGTAIWLHRSWRIYRFTIKGFTQPKLGDPREAMERLRSAGLSAWDDVENLGAFLRDLRS